MANKSSEYPKGLLTGDILKSFYAMSGDYPNFHYTPGHEAFPDSSCKRNPIDYYTIPYLSIDVNAIGLSHPPFFSVGRNTGKTNTFSGIDPANLTDGVYTNSNILQGNNLICHGLELSLQEAPDFLSGLYSDTNAAQDVLGTAIDQTTGALGCPKLNTINEGQFKNDFTNYPGYRKLKTGGTY